MATIVTDDFLNGGAWNESHIHGDTAAGNRQLAILQNNTEDLARLENADCIRQYGLNRLQPSWKNVLVVSESNVSGPLVSTYYHHAEYLQNDLDWICGKHESGSSRLQCDTQNMLANSTNWTIKDVERIWDPHSYTDPDDNRSYDGHSRYSSFEANVKYCLAERTEQRCTVQISTPLLGIVIICNLVKLLCLAGTLLARNFHPLATVGDLINSCLDNPDSYSRGRGPISAEDVLRSEALLDSITDRYRKVQIQHSESLLDRSRSSSNALEAPLANETIEKSEESRYMWERHAYRWNQASTAISWITCITL